MQTDPQHQHAIKIVAGYKAANRQTIQKVQDYDPVKKIWYLETVKVDPAAADYAKETILSDRKSKSKASLDRDKAANAKKVKKVVAKKTLQPKPKHTPKPRDGGKQRTEMRKNIVALRISGKSLAEIAKLYGRTLSAARNAYHKEMKENENKCKNKP